MDHIETYDAPSSSTSHSNDEAEKQPIPKQNIDIHDKLVMRMNCEVSTIKELHVPSSEKEKEKEKEEFPRLQVTLTDGSSFDVDCILCAMGITPNTQFIDEKKAKVEKDEKGALKVNE